MNQKTKISLIGGGNIGSTIAHIIAMKNLGNIVLIDNIKGIAQGKALDLLHLCAIEDIDAKIIGSNDFQKIENSDVIIVTAGMKRKPGMHREDLLLKNMQIMKIVGKNIKKYSPHAFVICITNPLDLMVKALQIYSQIADNKIVGMSGVLDSARFRFLLSLEFNVSIKQVHAYIVGEHGDNMFPLTMLSNIAGDSLASLIENKLLTKENLLTIIDKTRKSGQEIINLMQNNSAYYAPASAAVSMAESYLYNKNMILPCSTKIFKNNYPGISKDIFFGVPTKINANGALALNLQLTDEEAILLDKSINTLLKLNTLLDKLLVSDK